MVIVRGKLLCCFWLFQCEQKHIRVPRGGNVCENESPEVNHKCAKLFVPEQLVDRYHLVREFNFGTFFKKRGLFATIHQLQQILHVQNKCK